LSDEILIRVKAKHETDYDGSVIETQLTQEIVTFDQLLKEQSDYAFKCRGYMLIDAKNNKIDQKTADLLRSHGWIHIDTAKSREERKVVEQEYYLLDEEGKNSYYYDPKFTKVDIDNLTEDQLKQLAKSGKIVQVVGPKSVLPATQYKKLQSKRQQLEDKKLTSKLAADKKAQKKKLAEISAAKKLLEEAGEV